MRFVKGRDSQALCCPEAEQGIESLLAIRMLRLLIGWMKERLNERDDPENDVESITTPTFLNSFIIFLKGMYDPKKNGGWPFGHFVDRHKVEAIAGACDIDVCESPTTPFSPQFQPGLLYFQDEHTTKRKTKGDEESPECKRGKAA